MNVACRLRRVWVYKVCQKGPDNVEFLNLEFRAPSIRTTYQIGHGVIHLTKAWY